MDEQLREKFEAWAKDREYDTKKFAGEYEDFDARQAWFVWQAAAAATKEIHMDEQMPPLNHYDAAAHMYPCDLEEFKEGEIVREAFSIPVGSPTHGESVPLWTTEQMFAYAKEYAAALSQPAAQGDSRADMAKELANMHHDLLVVMQAAWIEWQRGAGANSAMQWIHNTLMGPGLIPDDDEPYASEPQAYFDANKSDPFPQCFCGRPSNQLWMGLGFCGNAHYSEHRASIDAPKATA